MAEYLKLKKSNCKNCYKCIRHCPVKSIKFSGNQAHIVTNECILCGQCFVVCPQNAKQIVDETELVKVLLEQDAPVYVSLAPSFVAYFEGAGISSMEKALKQLGFAGVEETAIGATIVKREYERLIAERKQSVIVSSCCHSVNLLVGKYYPQLLPVLAPVVTPMEAHCRDIKKRYPNAKVVFVGPCLSKKDEAGFGSVDAVLTFPELVDMLQVANIKVEQNVDENNESRARLFPTVGGILKTMDCTDNGYTYLTVDGIENCKAALEDIAAGNLDHCFIEMSSCAGSCIGGPVMEKYRNSPVRHFQAVSRYAGKEDFDVAQPETDDIYLERSYMAVPRSMPNEEQIKEILKKMGKNRPEDELNCGTCGYNTCREKAVAVFQGKADMTMCLPYLMERSERFSNNILNNTPNGILVVNEDLEVQQINKAAMQMLRVRTASDVLGELVVRIVDPTPFMDVLENGVSIKDQQTYYAEYEKYLELSIVHDRASHNLIAIMRDVTAETERRQKEAEIGRQTAEVADRVVEKQMRTVQEIAFLLGETAAETKIALTKLKESISHGEDE